MFIIGKTYEYTVIDETGTQRQGRSIVEKFKHPVLKFADRDISESIYATPRPPKGSGHIIHSNIIRGEIINVASAHFVKAVLVEEQELA